LEGARATGDDDDDDEDEEDGVMRTAAVAIICSWLWATTHERG
jgi:hypothetical protein